MDYIHLCASQYRVLAAIYLNPEITVNELIEKARVAWPPDTIQTLRRKGIKIISEFVPNPNELSNRQIVKYSVMPESQDLALYSLKHHKDKNKDK